MLYLKCTPLIIYLRGTKVNKFELGDIMAKKSEKKPRVTKKPMTPEEIQAWDDLNCYDRDKVMGYDENQALSSQMVLRLKGLLTNKFMENNNIKDTANYSFEVILNTFKYCYADINKVLRTNRFADEQHRFNTVLKIVERNINTVYVKMKNAEKAKEEAKNVTTNITYYDGAEYQRKTEEIPNKLLEDLW